MEVLDLYDDNFNCLNKTIIRRLDKIPDGANIMASYLLLKNDNKYLLEQSTERNNFKWSIPGGHKQHGESVDEGLKRELKEELNLNNINYTKVETIKFPYGKYIFNIFFSEDKININKLTYQKDEVVQIKWFNKEEIMSLIKQEKIARGYAYILMKYLQ